MNIKPRVTGVSQLMHVCGIDTVNLMAVCPRGPEENIYEGARGDRSQAFYRESYTLTSANKIKLNCMSSTNMLV